MAPRQIVISVADCNLQSTTQVCHERCSHERALNGAK